MKHIKSLLLMILLLTMIFTCVFQVTAKKNTKKTITISVGQTKKLPIKKMYINNKNIKIAKVANKYTWKSSNKKIAKVSKKGVVTGVKTGKATISAVLKKDKKIRLSYKIKVMKESEIVDYSEYEGISKLDSIDDPGSYFIDKVYYLKRIEHKTMTIKLNYNFKNPVIKKSEIIGYIINSPEEGAAFSDAIANYINDCKTTKNKPYTNIGEDYALFNSDFFKEKSLFIATGYITRLSDIGSCEGRIISGEDGKCSLVLISHYIKKDLPNGYSVPADMIPFKYIVVLPKKIAEGISEVKTTSTYN